MSTAHEGADDTMDFVPLRTAEGYYRHGCTGPCDQGRKPCPCPQACLQDEDQSNSGDATFIPFLLILCVFFALAVMGIWHMVERVYQ